MLVDIEVSLPKGLEVGARVRHDGGGNSALEGKEGAVLVMGDGNVSCDILVEFDEPIPNGHDGNYGRPKGKAGHCWWCFKENLDWR